MKLKIAIVLIFLLKYNWLLSNVIFQDKSNNISSSFDNKITWYEVTETINMPFGKSIVNYTVSSKDLINTNDLGPNNSRVIIEKSKTKKGFGNHKINSPINYYNSIDTNTSNQKKTIKTVTVNPIETYERMVDKGIKSIEMYKSLGDFYFFKNEYLKAILYYEALFKMTHNLDSEYYLRYSFALKNSGQIAQSEELLEKYKLLTAKQKN